MGVKWIMAPTFISDKFSKDQTEPTNLIFLTLPLHILVDVFYGPFSFQKKIYLPLFMI